jgi:phospholipase C
MATRYTANLYVTNNTLSTAEITVTYKCKTDEKTVRNVALAAGKTMGPTDIVFHDNTDTEWTAELKIAEGKTISVYRNTPNVFKTELEGKDSNKKQRVEVSIDQGSMRIEKPSGQVSTAMYYAPPHADIKHIFVLMLENRSFDHIFGVAKITGNAPVTGEFVTAAVTSPLWANAYDGIRTPSGGSPALDPLTSDPGHEFKDVFEQLCGPTVKWDKKQGYPLGLDMSGFVSNYATSTRGDRTVPTKEHRDDIMDSCATSQVSALHELAKEYAVCDHWFSSMPGPTWPNRLFAMTGTSKGMDSSPTNDRMIKWESVDGLEMGNGSIFDAVKASGRSFRIYQDDENQFAKDPAGVGGWIAIASALENIDQTKVYGFSEFPAHLSGWKLDEPKKPDYTTSFTFIEPNYGNAIAHTYAGGSSQHPMDSLTAGDKMIAAVYKAIRNSPIWQNSLLIITYDEHGGFFDHMAPPMAVAPGGKTDKHRNKYGFDFTQYGVRVPAVVVSPYIPKNTVDQTLYDHTSIIKTTASVFSLPHLTHRDKTANSLTRLLCGPLRTDCPTTVTAAADPPAARGFAAKPVFNGPPDDAPLPESGNIIGFLHIAAKIDFELSDKSEISRAAIIARVESIKTYGEAREYFREIAARVKAYKAALRTTRKPIRSK